jgi:hypothetical protein
MKKILMFCFLLVLARNIFAVPTLIEASSMGTTIKFTAKLSEKLSAGYKVKIDYGNGKGLVAMTCSLMTCTLSSNLLPSIVNSATYKIGIYNAKNVLEGQAITGSYVITTSILQNLIDSPPTQNVLPTNSSIQTDYKKISNTGIEVSESAVLGSGPNDWACTKDNKTGLIWEVKTSDGGFRDKYKTYKNYFLGDKGFGASTNVDNFVKSVNQKKLCGAANWRLPTNNELQGLIYCSDNKYNALGNDVVGFICTNYSLVTKPTINQIYFPNTFDTYWTSSVYLGLYEGAWYVDFMKSDTHALFKDQNLYVRLVH